jgi:hypothetical protein
MYRQKSAADPLETCKLEMPAEAGVTAYGATSLGVLAVPRVIFN